MTIHTIIIIILAFLLLLLTALHLKTRYINKSKLPSPIEADVLVLKHVKVPSQDTVMFQNKVVCCKKNFGEHFFFKEIYWLLSPEGELIENMVQKTDISKDSCIFALSPCTIGNILIRGTRINNKQSAYSAYKLLCITETELVFIKTTFEPKNLFIMKYLMHDKAKAIPFPDTISVEHISF